MSGSAPIPAGEEGSSRAGLIVAVTGSTGRQGGAVAAHLLADGWHVRALTRDPGGRPAARLRAMGAEVVGCDMGDPDSLRRALQGTYGAYSVQNPMISGLEAEVAHGTNVAQAARDAGVRHVVYGSAGPGLSGTGVGSWESKLRVQARMADLGLPVTVLRPMAFMELMTDRAFFPPVAMWHLMPKMTGEDMPVGWISVDDIGAVAARVFGDPARYVGTELEVVSDVRSNAECRRIWRTVTGRQPRRFPMPVPMFERFVGTDLTTMWRWLRSAGLRFDPAPTRRILPTAASVDEWLTRRRGGPSRQRSQP